MTARHFVELPFTGTVVETNRLDLWPEAKRLTAKEGKARLHAEALKALREYLKPGDTVYTSVLHVSTSGMTRHIALRIIRNDEPINITYQAGRVLDWRVSEKTGGLIVDGCGMDMCFHTVYCLSSTLFPLGQFECIGERCPANDHSNGDRTYTPHTHSDGGYALRARDL